MSLKDDLLAAVWEQPHADHPRLVYADWLEEQGDAARAEFIRLQCEHFRMEKYLDEWYDLGDRIEKLWQKHKKAWQAELPASVNKFRFERGFVAPPLRDITAAKFMSLTEKELAAAPLWRFAIKGRGKNLQQACHHSNATRLQEFSFRDDNVVTYTDIRAVFESERWSNLESLRLEGQSVDDTAMAVFCDRTELMPRLCRLRLLNISGTDLTLERLAGSAMMPRIESFDLDQQQFTTSGIELFARHPGSKSLKELGILLSETNDAAQQRRDQAQLMKVLFNAPNWNELHSLSVNPCHAPDAVAALEASSPCFRLRRLMFRIEGGALKNFNRFLNWPGLQSVRELGFYRCWMTDAIANSIAAHDRHLPDLRRLFFVGYDHGNCEKADSILRGKYGRIAQQCNIFFWYMNTGPLCNAPLRVSITQRK